MTSLARRSTPRRRIRGNGGNTHENTRSHQHISITPDPRNSDSCLRAGRTSRSRCQAGKAGGSQAGEARGKGSACEAGRSGEASPARGTGQASKGRGKAAPAKQEEQAKAPKQAERPSRSNRKKRRSPQSSRSRPRPKSSRSQPSKPSRKPRPTRAGSNILSGLQRKNRNNAQCRHYGSA